MLTFPDEVMEVCQSQVDKADRLLLHATCMYDEVPISDTQSISRPTVAKIIVANDCVVIVFFMIFYSIKRF